MKTVFETMPNDMQGNNELVKCFSQKCKHVHQYGERIVKPEKQFSSRCDIVCPKCEHKATIEPTKKDRMAFIMLTKTNYFRKTTDDLIKMNVEIKAENSKLTSLAYDVILFANKDGRIVDGFASRERVLALKEFLSSKIDV